MKLFLCIYNEIVKSKAWIIKHKPYHCDAYMIEKTIQCQPK